MNFLIDKNGEDLSAVQKKLIEIARVLVHNPKVLLIEEAFADLRPVVKTILRNVLEKELRGSTIGGWTG